MSPRLGAALVSMLLAAAPALPAQAELRRPGPALGFRLAAELGALARSLPGKLSGTKERDHLIGPSGWAGELAAGWQDFCAATDLVRARVEELAGLSRAAVMESLREQPLLASVARLLQLSLALPPEPLAAEAKLGQKERRRLRQAREIALFRATQTGPFDAILADAAEKNGLDVFLFKGLLINESRLDPTLSSRKVVRVVNGRKKIVSGGAVGIAQFTPSGVRGVNRIRKMRARPGEVIEEFTVEKAKDPSKAIYAAAELLSYLIEQFGRDGGVTAYNTGPGPARAVAKYGFYEARRLGLLCKAGDVRLQGYRFLLNVLNKTNRLRAEVGLPPLDPPRERRRMVADRLGEPQEPGGSGVDEAPSASGSPEG